MIKMIITKTKLYETVLLDNELMSMVSHDVSFNGELYSFKGGLLLNKEAVCFGEQFHLNPLDAIARIDSHNQKVLRQMQKEIDDIDVYLDGVYRLAINSEKQYA